MKKFNYKTLLVCLLLLPVVTLFVTSCFDITGVTQPASAKVGETIDITVNVNYDSEDENQNQRFLIFGMLVPKSWEVAKNATVVFKSSIALTPERPGSGNMIVDPVAGETPSFWGDKSRGLDGQKTGNSWTTDMNNILDIGENYGKVEWVSFRSENPIDATIGDTTVDGTITVTLKVGAGHSGVQMGYWVGYHGNGFKQEDPLADSTPSAKSRHWDSSYKSIAITGAGADATDLTGPAPTSTAAISSPEGYMFDDIITIKFDAKEGKDGANTALFNAGAVNMNATALMGDATTVIKADRDAASSMTLTGNNVWELTIWPPAYFSVPAGNIITELHLSFSNADGTVLVQNPGYSSDIVLGTKCE